MQKKIEIYDHDPNWPKYFEEEKKILIPIFQDNFMKIHHFGSSAISGLKSKNVIDILVELKSIEFISNIALTLQKNDYDALREFFPLCYFCQKEIQDAHKNYKINLHITFSGNGFINAKLNFKNYLLKNEEAKIEYSKLKMKLLENIEVAKKNQGSILNNYNLGKNAFIQKTMKNAWKNEQYNEFEKLVINFCMHENEWKAFHEINKFYIFDPLKIKYDPSRPSFSNENFYNFVLYYESEIISIAQIEKIKNTNVCVLRLLATKLQFQKKGYTKYFVTFLEKWIKESLQFNKKINTLKLHANPNAYEFYKKIGYEEIDFSEDIALISDCIDVGKTL